LTHGLPKRPLVLISAAFFTGIVLFHQTGDKLYPIILLVPISIALLAFMLLRPGKRLWPLILASFFLGGFLDLCGHRPSQLWGFADLNQPIRIKGIVIEETKRDEASQVFLLRASWVQAEGWKEVDENVQVIVKMNPQHLWPGMGMVVMGRLSQIKGFNTPGASRAVERYKARGIHTRLIVADGRYIVPLDTGKGALEKGLLAIRENSMCFLKEALPEGLYTLGAAILLGEKALVPQETKELFSKTGLSHVLVVSGLHIGMVMAVTFLGVRWILRWLPLTSQMGGFFISAILSGCMVVFYTHLTGFQISGTRAMIMSLIFVISIVTFRLTDPWTTLAFAGILIVAIDPHNLFSLSFQLSFLSVVGIIWTNRQFLIPFSKWINQKEGIPFYLRKLIIYIISLALLSIGTNAFLLPILVYNFNQFSVIGILSNILSVPVLGILVVPFGMISIILSQFSYSIAKILIIPCGYGLRFIQYIVTSLGAWEFSSFYWVTPYLWEMGIYYVLLSLTFISFKGRSLKAFALISLMLFLGIHLAWVNYVPLKKGHEVRISFLDVGQGSSSLLLFEDGTTVLVDAGGIPNVEYDIGKEVVSKFLWHERIRKIDIAVLTHGDMDHSGGYNFILKAFKIKEFWAGGDVPGFLKERIASTNIALIDVSHLNQIEMHNARFEFFHPRKETMEFCKDENDKSLVFKILWGNRSILMTGDNGKEILTKIAQIYGTKVTADVLLVPHHGSKNSLSMEFLKAVKPKIAVVSCGIRNPFHFPHKEVVNALDAIGAKVLSTNWCGAVMLQLDPGKDEITYRSYNTRELKVERPSQPRQIECSGRVAID